MKILLAERDELERKGMKWLLLTNQVPIDELKETSSDEECMELLIEWKPDIFVMELEMFQPNQRENLFRTVRNMGIQTIMHTSHKTFQAAEQAVKIKAEALFVKPYVADEWLKAFKQIIRNQRNIPKNEGESSLYHGWAYDLLFGRVLNESFMSEQIKNWGYDQVPSIVAVLALDQQNKKEFEPITLIQYIHDELQEYRPFVLSAEEHIALLVSEEYLPKGNDPIHSLWLVMMVFCERMKEKNNLSISVGIGNQYVSPKLLYKSYFEAKQALLRRFYFGGNQIFPSMTKKLHDPYEHFLSPTESDELTRYLNEGNREMTKTWFYQVFGGFPYEDGSYPHSDFVRIKLTNVLSHIRRFMTEKQFLFYHDQEYQEVFREVLYGEVLYDIIQKILQFCSLLFDRVEKENVQYGSLLIKKAVQYIDQYYCQPITLEDVSGIVGRSSQYFSSLFKQQMGSTFTEYLQAKKIEKAKEYLKTTSMSVSEVAEAVGYLDPNYFSRVFKIITGNSPRAWKTKNSADILK
ncbi:AraC family transcriptional regulator [Bacillus salipaludis]|uniref:AraC family transcriptional regulator n=1 Tax=Bacillus salipaludis TaxID=2547811 RepID=A0A4R5VJP3_9BACI|nr:helix-turn-helix domain-containing protein [Bacillus salipaludis]TDK58113.1 AraC family transcriptional regulator [Bacillus salipaludis]